MPIPVSQIYINPCYFPGHSLFQFRLSKKTKLSLTILYSNNALMNIAMMLQTVMFQALTSLSSWCMLFQEQTLIADTESATHACKNHTISAENYLYLLVSNI